MNDVFRVSADGGTPMEVAADRYTNEYFAAPVTRRRRRWRSPRAPRVGPSGGATAAAISTRARSGSSRRRPRLRATKPVTSGGAKEMWPMWARRRQDALLRVGPQRRAERLAARPSANAGAPAGQGADQLQGRPCAVAVDLAGRPPDRVRARLRASGRSTPPPAGPRGVTVIAARRAGRRRRRAPHADRSDSGAGAVARRQEGRVRRPRRGLRRLGQGRRRRRARQPHSAGERAAAGLVARQPAARLSSRIATAPHTSTSTTSRPGTETRLTTAAQRRSTRRASRPTASRSRSSANSRELRVIDPGTKEDNADRHRRVRPPPFVDPPSIRLVARHAVARLPVDGRQGVHQRVRRAGSRRHAAEDRGGQQVSFLANAFAGTLAWSPDGSRLTFRHRPAHRAAGRSRASI